MSDRWDWPGSRWWRVDLHAHSPASYDFGSPQDREAKDWQRWVESALEAGLDAIAVTDHNSPNGIAGIQEAAKGTGLVVFPGVEVTLAGVHLLCLFDPSQGHNEVVSLLGKLGIEPSQYGHDAASATKSLLDTLEIAASAGALVIAAHANGPKGLLKLENGDRAKVLLDPTAKQPSWVKMTKPDLEGLRLALLDGSSSVREASDPDPNRHASLVIESIAIHKARYMGNGQPLEICWNPWLNAVIGGRGTGKSTVIDLLRKNLRREGELPESLRAEYNRRLAAPADRHSEGLLRNDTEVEVVYRKDGDRFRITWNAANDAEAIQRLTEGGTVAEAGKVAERFPVRIYSQKQLFELASEPDALLTILDESPEVGGASLRSDLEQADKDFLAHRAEARRYYQRAAALADREATLADLQRKLEVLQRGGHDETFRLYRARREQDTQWQAVVAAAKTSIDSLWAAAVELTVADLAAASGREGDTTPQALQAAHGELLQIVTDLQAETIEALSRATNRLEGWEQGPNVTAWSQAVTEAEGAFQAASEQLSQEGLTSPTQFGELLQRVGSLEQEIASLHRDSEQAELQEKLAADALARARALSAELTQRRRALAERVAGDSAQVRVEIVGHGQRDRKRVEAELRRILGVEHFVDDVTALAAQIDPTPAAPWSFAPLDRLVEQLRAFAEGQTGGLALQDQRFAARLRNLPPETFDRLALYQPEDAVRVQFNAAKGSRPEWRSLEHGSPGQKTAALLAFVLGYGEEPILLDQPEDDLDNALIYDLLVRRLKSIKATRQVIVVTHNANLVVHGDAELVLSLRAGQGQTVIHASGGLQEDAIRSEICRVLEGGAEAFRLRFRRILGTGETR